MATKPEPIGTFPTPNFTATTSPKETTELTVAKGDVLVAMATVEDDAGTQTMTISGGGLTWVEQKKLLTTSNCPMWVWTAEATEAKSFKATYTHGGGTNQWGGCVQQWRKSSGIGAVAGVNNATGAPSLAITTVQAHSAIAMFDADWEAKTGTPAYRTGPGSYVSTVHTESASHYTIYGGYYSDVEKAEAQTVGITSPAGQKYTIIAIEIKGLEEEEKTETFEFSPTGTSASTGEEVDVFAWTEALSGTSGSTFAEVDVFTMEEPVAGTSVSTGEASSESKTVEEETFSFTVNGTSTSSGSMSDEVQSEELVAGTSSSSGSESDALTLDEGIVNGSSSSTGSEVDSNGWVFEESGTSESIGESEDSSAAEESLSGTSLSSGSIEEQIIIEDVETGTSTSSGSATSSFVQEEPSAPVVHPIEHRGRRRIVQWRFMLVDSNNLEEIGEIKAARNKQVELALDKPGGVQFEVPLDYGLFNEIKEIKHGVVAYRNKVAQHSGMIWNLNEDADNNKLSVQTVGWFETLNHRILRENVGYPPFSTGVVNAGQIVFMPASGTVGTTSYHPGGLLTIANGQHETWISEGTNKDKMQRIISYAKAQSIGGAINQLSEIEAGFDFWIDPLTRVMSITNWNEVSDKTDEVVFGYNWGPNNMEKLSRQFDPSNMVNRMTALGKYGGGFAEDVEAQNEYQLFEEMPQLNEVTDPNVLLAYAGGEVLLRGSPRQIFSFIPFPYSGTGREPQPFVDYGIGDKVVFTALKAPRVDIRGQAVRIYGMNISITDEGNEKLSSLQISPS